MSDELEEEILEELRRIRKAVERDQVVEGVVPDNLEEELVPEVREKGDLTKQEVMGLLDLSGDQALEAMKNVEADDVRYVSGYGNRQSRLYYTGTEVAKKAIELINMLDRASKISREEAEERLETEGKQIHKVVKLARRFSDGKIMWDGGDIKKMK